MRVRASQAAQPCAMIRSKMAPPSAPPRWLRRSLQSRQGSPPAFEGVDIDARLGEKPSAACRHAQRIAATGEQPALHEPVEHSDRQIACKMVIAGARLAQFGIARTGADAGVAGTGSQRNQSFKRARDLRVGETEIAVPSLAFDRDKSGIFKLGEMPAGGREHEARF